MTPPLASDARTKSPLKSTPTQHSARWSPRVQPQSQSQSQPEASGASLELIAHSVDAAQRWKPNKLSDLGLKLAALQYRLPFDAQSADLVERLFADLMTSVETNKKVMVELRNLKEKNIQMEQALRDQLLSKSKGVAVDERKLQSRIFRLTRLTESLLFICAQLTSDGSAQPAVCDWSGASVSLLSLLLSYEKQIEETQTTDSTEASSTVKEFPPFLREFHSVWRAHEERDELQHQLREKDRQIANLLMASDTKDAPPQEPPADDQREAKLLRAVEAIKAQIGTRFTMPDESNSLLGDLQKWKNQVKTLETEKKTQEEHIKRLEKRFASVLKKQQELEGMCRSASPNCGGSHRSVSGGSEDEEQTRKHRAMLRMINDREIDAFESAKEAWRHERLLLEAQREERDKEIQLLKRQINQIEDDMDEAAKKYTRLLGQLDKANEALGFAQNRIEFFERTEIERQQAQADTIKQMQEMHRELEEVKSVLRARENELAEQSVQLDDIGRTLVASDAQLQSALRERDSLSLRLKKVTEELDQVSLMCTQLQTELRNLEESRDMATEKIQSQSDDLQHHLQEIDMFQERLSRNAHEIDQLKDEIDQMRMTLRKAGEVKHSLESQLTKAITERASYKQSALEARQSLKDAQDMYAALESKYRALLLELEGVEPQAEHLNSSVASMIPPTVWNARVEDKNEEIRLLYDQIETLHKEVRAFRKSRDQAIKQRKIAVDNLKVVEDELRKLQNANSSLTSTTQVLHKRLRNYSQRIEMLDGIIAQQRNHILTHRMDTVPEEDSGASAGKASAAVRYLLSRTQASVTPITISSRPLSDPFRVPSSLLSSRQELTSRHAGYSSQRDISSYSRDVSSQRDFSSQRDASSVPALSSQHGLSSGPHMHQSRRLDPTPFPLKPNGEPITPLSGTVPPEASEDSGFVSPIHPASTELLWIDDGNADASGGHMAFEAGPSVTRADGNLTDRQIRTEEWSAGPSGTQVDRLDATERTESVVDISSGSEGTLQRKHSSPMSLSGSDIHRAQFGKENQQRPERAQRRPLQFLENKRSLKGESQRAPQFSDIAREQLRFDKRNDFVLDTQSRPSRDSRRSSESRRVTDSRVELQRDPRGDLQRERDSLGASRNLEESQIDSHNRLDDSHNRLDDSHNRLDESRTHLDESRTRLSESEGVIQLNDSEGAIQLNDSEGAPGYLVDYRDDLDNSGTWRRLELSQDENQTQVSRWDSLMYSSRLSNPAAEMTTSGTVIDEESMWQLSETSGGKHTIDKALSNWDFSEGGETLRTKSIPRSDA